MTTVRVKALTYGSPRPPPVITAITTGTVNTRYRRGVGRWEPNARSRLEAAGGYAQPVCSERRPR